MKFIHEYILVNDDQVNIKDFQQLAMHSHVLVPNTGFQLCCFLFLILEKKIVFYNLKDKIGWERRNWKMREEKERHVEKEKGRLEKNRRTEERKENAGIYMTASKHLHNKIT